MQQRWIAAGLALVAAVAVGCAHQVPGNALSGPEPVRSQTSAPPTENPLESAPPSAPPKMQQKLCALVSFEDLPFKGQGDNAQQPVAQTNIDADFDQSCRWTYEIQKPQLKVGAQLYYRKERDLTVKDPTGSYTVGGRQLSYAQTGPASCVLSMKYADGHVGLGIIDGSGLFGEQCDAGRKLAEVLLTREPQALS
ncbi:MAG: DUF3558 family protein [Kibdelosporangium sp.]